MQRMTESRRARRGRIQWRGATALLGLVLLFFALAHSLEDFAYRVPEERFDLDSTVAAVLLAGAFLVQGAVVMLAWRGWALGYLASLVVGGVWLLAAVLDHAGDLFDDSFRESSASDVLILGVIVSSLLLALAAAWVLFRDPERRAGSDEDGAPLEGYESRGEQG